MRIPVSENKELSIIDAISILSFIVGLENLDLNVTQNDLQEESAYLDGELRLHIKDVHDHLAVQDAKLNLIMEMLKEKEK